MAHESATMRNDLAFNAYLARSSKSRRGKLSSADKYFSPQTIGLVWTNPSGRTYSLDGTQTAPTSLTWSSLFDIAATWTISITVSSYVAGSFTVGNSEDSSAAINANGDYSIELVNYEDFDLLITADAAFNGSVTINTIKRLS